MTPPKRFFIRVGKNQLEVVWKLHAVSGTFHATRPKGTVTACGKKPKLTDPPPEATDPSDHAMTCLTCAENVVRVLRDPKPVNLKQVIYRARQAQN